MWLGGGAGGKIGIGQPQWRVSVGKSWWCLKWRESTEKPVQSSSDMLRATKPMVQLCSEQLLVGVPNLFA